MCRYIMSLLCSFETIKLRPILSIAMESPAVLEMPSKWRLSRAQRVNSDWNSTNLFIYYEISVKHIYIYKYIHMRKGLGIAQIG